MVSKLIELSKKFESLKLKQSEEQTKYFQKKSATDITNEIKQEIIPKWKQIENECKKIENQFVQIAGKFADENKFSNKDLTNLIIGEVLKTNFKSINQFLVIRLLWEIGGDKNDQFCLRTLEKWIRGILEIKKIGFHEEYYLESLLDIWNHDTDELIPIEILEKIILLEPKIGNYGALIKAIAYISDHPTNEIERVLAKARKTKSYEEDETYRDWID